MENTMKCLCRGENKTQLLIAVGYTGAFEDIEDSTSASDFERRVTGCRINFPLAEEVGAQRCQLVWAAAPSSFLFFHGEECFSTFLWKWTK